MRRPSESLTDGTAWFVARHGGWRVLVTLALASAPMYVWIQFYYLSTGAWNQSRELVVGNAPLLATFFVPLIFAAWAIGFRGWYILVGALAAAVIAGWTSPDSIAAQLLPYGYINLGIVLALLMIFWRAFCYWRDRHIHVLPVTEYTDGARALVVGVAVILLVLLMPIKL